jgi:hypothetical protein
LLIKHTWIHDLTQALFSMVLPEASMKGDTLQPSLQNHTCTASTISTPEGSGVIVSCQYDVPAERANALCSALMEQVQPEQVRQFV